MTSTFFFSSIYPSKHFVSRAVHFKMGFFIYNRVAMIKTSLSEVRHTHYSKMLSSPTASL